MGKPSGFARLEWDGKRLALIGLQRLATHGEVLDALPEGEPAWIGLDAPVLIRNESGTRQADRDAHRLFSRQHAGCYPVHLGLPFAPGVLALVSSIRELGFATELPLDFQTGSKHLFEVYPNAATLRLFDLPRILPYKKGPLAARRDALEQFRHLLLTGLKNRRPSLAIAELPPCGETLTQLKACEDQLDAVLCAYIAAHFWYWGLARNNVLGNPPDGFIVNPSF